MTCSISAVNRTISAIYDGELIVGLFLVLLPSHLRQRWFAGWHGDLRTSAMLSGIAQVLSGLAILVGRYPRFAEQQMAVIDQRVFIAAAEQSGESAVRGFGLLILLAYIIQPLTILLAYFAIEGAVRLIGAVGTGEVVGSLRWCCWKKPFANGTLTIPRRCKEHEYRIWSHLLSSTAAAMTSR